jgi:hypothetical protein
MLKRRQSKASTSSSSYSDDKDEEYEPPAAGAKKESQESQESQKSGTGMSQDFFAVLKLEGDDVSCLSPSSAVAQSIGVVCMASRPSTNKKQKDIKKFALQKTFYAFPKDCKPDIKNKIQERIDNDIADFRFQKYDVSIHRFGLPFEVEEVCCVSRGYSLLPKILKAPPPVKRKRDVDNDDEEAYAKPVPDDDKKDNGPPSKLRSRKA